MTSVYANFTHFNGQACMCCNTTTSDLCRSTQYFSILVKKKQLNYGTLCWILEVLVFLSVSLFLFCFLLDFKLPQKVLRVLLSAYLNVQYKIKDHSAEWSSGNCSKREVNITF